MKCALEIVAMKELAETNYRIEQERLDEECRIKHMSIIEDTFNYCEEVIGPKLEKCALDREVPRFTLRGIIKTDRVGNKIFHPLVVESKKYANGDYSYCPSYSKSIDVKSLINYLKNYCFTVKFEEITYKKYGCGECDGYLLTVTI
jgi:hypothetical protein